jgi:hypothetical protein
MSVFYRGPLMTFDVESDPEPAKDSIFANLFKHSDSEERFDSHEVLAQRQAAPPKNLRAG